MTPAFFRALLAFAKRIPAMAYVIALVVAALAASGTALYLRGVHHGEVHVHRIVLADSTRAATQKKDTATAHSNTVVAVARQAHGVSETTRARRVAVRTAALAQLMDTLPEVHALVAFDDTLSQRDSVTIAVQAGAIDTLLAERATRERLDSLRVETIQIGSPEPDHHTTAKIVGGAIAGIVAVLAVLHFVGAH